MGSLVSPIVANLYMDYLEQKALSTAPHPPGAGAGLWMTPLSSTRKSTNKTSSNTLTVLTLPSKLQEDNKEDGSIPFCDTIVKPEENVGLSITVYRKPTHTDQYLQWDSHHNLSAKFSIINTLSHRAKTVCSNPELLKQEKKHLREALTQCKYPKWALDRVEKRLNRSSSEAIDRVNNQGTNCTSAATKEVKSNTQGLCESIKKICGRYGIQTHFKDGSTIKNLLVSPKDEDPMVSQSMPSIGINVGTLPVMMNTYGKPPGPSVKDTKNT